MSFTNTPVSRLLVFGVVTSSIITSVLDIKHYFYILFDLHVWRYRQLWRFITYQLCYTNSTEVLFAAMTMYNLRMIERMWGSRKLAVSLIPLCPPFGTPSCPLPRAIGQGTGAFEALLC